MRWSKQNTVVAAFGETVTEPYMAAIFDASAQKRVMFFQLDIPVRIQGLSIFYPLC